MIELLSGRPPKKNLSCPRQIRLWRKIVTRLAEAPAKRVGATPRLRRGFAQYEPPPFRPPAGGFEGGFLVKLFS